MYRYPDVRIRKFQFEDIPLKLEWVNNPQNNQFLHYDLPLKEENTLAWFHRVKTQNNRYDAVIEADGVPVGTIGLLSIDTKNQKAEYYIAMGEVAYKGKGIAKRASALLLDYAFRELLLNRVYLYTETKNISAQKLFERVGFRQEGCIRQDLLSRGQYVDRYIYGILKSDWDNGDE